MYLLMEPETAAPSLGTGLAAGMFDQTSQQEMHQLG